MLTHPKSTIRILRMLRHMSLSNVPLLRGEFHSPKLCFSSAKGLFTADVMFIYIFMKNDIK